jgi:hypothetical protein
VVEVDGQQSLVDGNVEVGDVLQGGAAPGACPWRGIPLVVGLHAGEGAEGVGVGDVAQLAAEVHTDLRDEARQYLRLIRENLMERHATGLLEGGAVGFVGRDEDGVETVVQLLPGSVVRLIGLAVLAYLPHEQHEDDHHREDARHDESVEQPDAPGIVGVVEQKALEVVAHGLKAIELHPLSGGINDACCYCHINLSL